MLSDSIQQNMRHNVFFCFSISIKLFEYSFYFSLAPPEILMDFRLWRVHTTLCRVNPP